MTPQQKAREIGEHIFRWGLSCEDCTPEDFKIEMAKAVKQLKQFLSLREKEVRADQIEKDARIACGVTVEIENAVRKDANYCGCSNMSKAIRQQPSGRE